MLKNKEFEDAIDELKAPFAANQINWRKGGGNIQLAYLNARNVMQRLDQVLGAENWQDRYEETAGRLMCYLSIRVGGEWIVKADGSGDTKIESEKGGISSAFKRSAVKFGVGRYLYYLPTSAGPNNMPFWALPPPPVNPSEEK